MKKSLGLVLISVMMLLVGCQQTTGESMGGVLKTPTTPRFTKNLSTDYVGYTINTTAIVPELRVEATVMDGESITYQWYKNTKNSTKDGIAIPNATNATYTPDITTVGTKYYYVIAKNSITDNDEIGAKKASITSNVATIIVLIDTIEFTNDGKITDYQGDETILTIPHSINSIKITSIDREAFASSGSLTSVEIPSSVTNIAKGAFRNCVCLKKVKIPSSITTIEDDTFAYCNSLTSVQLPSSVTKIGSSAFVHCGHLTSVEIPSSVTEIKSTAFSDCSSLTNIEIPSSVTSLGLGTFQKCIRLTSVTVNSSIPPVGENLFSSTPDTLKIFVPNGAVDTYRCSDGWKTYADKIIEQTS